MPLNSLYPRGDFNEQNMVEDLIIETIRATGQEFYYIPRVLVAPDEVFGEDNLSKYLTAFQIEGYLDNIDNFGGQGSFIQKFGLFIEEQGQITIARKRWEQLIGQYNATVIPTRPCEGDLLYFEKAKSLFEIKFVDHQNPFYQIGRLFVYKLKVELFQYSNERIDTDIEELNRIALDLTFDTAADSVPHPPFPSTERKYGLNEVFQTESEKSLDFSEHNPFGE